MKRCKHLNCEIVEFGTMETWWGVENGVPEKEGYHNPGDFLPYVVMNCKDCKAKRRYSITPAGMKRAPLVVKRWKEEVYERTG